jgi:hypothetical protein
VPFSAGMFSGEILFFFLIAATIKNAYLEKIAGQ